jgi:hypothetical protein
VLGNPSRRPDVLAACQLPALRRSRAVLRRFLEVAGHGKALDAIRREEFALAVAALEAALRNPPAVGRAHELAAGCVKKEDSVNISKMGTIFS